MAEARNDRHEQRRDHSRRFGGYGFEDQRRRDLGRDDDRYLSRDYGRFYDRDEERFGRGERHAFEPGLGRRDFGRDFERHDLGRGDFGRDESRDFERRDFGRDFDRDRERGDRRDFGRDYGRDMERGDRRDFGRDMERGDPRDFGRDFGRDMERGDRRDFGRDMERGDPRDLGREYGRDFGRNLELGDRRYFGAGTDSDRDERGDDRWQRESRRFEERQRGQHAGKGPQGYRKSDTRIEEQACEALSDAADVDARQIELKVKEGEVTLTGTVDDRRAKRRAEELVEGITGVKDVLNQLKIQARAAQGATQEAGGRQEGMSQTDGGTRPMHS